MRVLAFTSVVALLIGASACSAPSAARGAPSTEYDEPTNDRVALTDSHSYRLTASKETRSATGVKTWRLLDQGQQTVVVEGVDAKGRVEIATSFQYSNDVLHIVAYRVGAKKYSDDVALTKWRGLMKAFTSDAGAKRDSPAVTEPRAPSLRAKVRQSCWGFWCTQVIDGTDGDNDQSCSGFYCHNVIRNPAAGSNNSQRCSALICRNTIEHTQNATQAFNEISDLASETTQQEEEGDSTNDEAPTDTDADSDFDDESDDFSDETADDEGDISADEQDDDLDDFGDEGDEGDEDFGDDDDFDDEDDVDFGDDDDGEDEYALHTACRHLSCSKSTTVCICTRY